MNLVTHYLNQIYFEEMDPGSARNAANAAAKNNRVLFAGVAGVAILGYLWYKRNSNVHNIGDAVSFKPYCMLCYGLSPLWTRLKMFVNLCLQASRAGAATGRGLESAGERVGGALKEEGKGFQGKQQ